MEKLTVPFEIKEVTDEGIIEGYGSTFGGAPDSYRPRQVKIGVDAVAVAQDGNSQGYHVAPPCPRLWALGGKRSREMSVPGE